MVLADTIDCIGAVCVDVYRYGGCCEVGRGFVQVAGAGASTV